MLARQPAPGAATAPAHTANSVAASLRRTTRAPALLGKLHETEPLPNSDEDEAADELSDEDDALEEGALERILLKMGVVGELLLLFVKGDRWWMAPLVLLLCVLGAVLVVLNSLEYVAPFIYMAF